MVSSPSRFRNASTSERHSAVTQTMWKIWCMTWPCSWPRPMNPAWRSRSSAPESVKPDRAHGVCDGQVWLKACVELVDVETERSRAYRSAAVV